MAARLSSPARETAAAKTGRAGKICRQTGRSFQPDAHPAGISGATGGKPSGRPAEAERPKSRIKTAERGAERCHLKQHNEAAFSAPSELPLKPRRQNRA